MTLELVAVALTLVVHLLGAGVLIWALLDGERFDWRVLWPRDDSGGGGGRGPEDSGDGDGSGGGGSILTPPLLPNAGGGGRPVRLREPGRISERHPLPPRRPEHLPAPRVPERA